jgi:hypothetical protein
MRILATVSIVALVLASQAAHAQEKTPKSTSPTAEEKTLNPGALTAEAEASRKKAEEMERAWSRKLQRATRSICIGC